MNILGYTLFLKIFDNPSSYNMYITYSFYGVQFLINIFYILILLSYFFAYFYMRKKLLRITG